MEAFRIAYPTLFQLLEGTPIEADATAAAALAQSRNDMKEALQGRIFALNELMWLLCGAVVPEWANPEAAKLESDLASIVGAVGIDIARATYRNKLLVEATTKIQDPEAKLQEAKNSLEDVCYEIAVTARACDVLDEDSVELERPIPDPKKDQKFWKNSDVFGTFQGRPVRIEVTVLHEKLPPAIQIELDDIVRQADVPSGLSITLREVLIDVGYAERVRALLELLHGCYIANGPKDKEIDGVRFEWKNGAYHCRQETAPFESICFYEASETPGSVRIREIIHPCSVRAVTPKYILEDNPNPPGVVTFADAQKHWSQVPVSTKVHQMLDGKRQQCEDGMINIVALGNPLLMHDREVLSAVCGAEVALIPFWTDRHGVRHAGRGVLRRDAKAPFVPAIHAESEDDLTQFIEPFKKMSGVWHVRIGTYARSRIIPNPNALVPIPDDLVSRLSDAPAPPEVLPAGDYGDPPKPSPTELAEQPEVSDQEEEIVWAEVAEDYVSFCGSISEARSVLARLEQTGLTIDELRVNVNQIWSEPSKASERSYVFRGLPRLRGIFTNHFSSDGRRITSASNAAISSGFSLTPLV